MKKFAITLFSLTVIFSVVLIIRSTYESISSDDVGIDDPNVEFPIDTEVLTAPDTMPVGPDNNVSDGLQIFDINGVPLQVKNFLLNETTRPDPINTGRYLLAGNLQICADEQYACQAGPVVDYNIYYDERYGSFTVALLNEPVGEVRLLMERALLQLLGLAPTDLCRLNYYVGTPSDVNSVFSGGNLGFSFCPGSTPLPQ